MRKRIISASIAAMMMSTALMSGAEYAESESSASYELEVNISTDGFRREISPYIYGVNSNFRTEEYLYDASAGSARQGGNRFSGYNWETNYSNAGRDWLHSSDQYLVDFDKELLAIPGGPAIEFAQEAAAKNVPYKITTVQMAGYVSADDDGEVTEEQIAPSERWIEVKARKGSDFSLTPDTTDNYVYIDEYVNYLVETLGDASTETGYQAYNLDNEPSLWSSTHSRMHPDKVSCEEIISKSIDYSSAIKDVDPKAEIFGLALYGVGAYVSFSNAPDWGEHSDEYDWFVSYYLDEMRKAEAKHGKRLVDVIDVHYYSEAKGQCRVTECEDYTHTECIEARLQSPRTLYDPMYIEDSWIGNSFQGYLPIFPKLNESIEKYYPETKLALTEYNFGGGNHISGAIAEADALGVFASNGVYVSNLWAINSDFSYQLSAIDLYTNYDRNGSCFGDTLVTASTSDITKGTAYASIHGADESKLNMILTNKSLTDVQNSIINIDSGAEYTSAKIYGITGNSNEIQLLQTIDVIENNSLEVSIPALSVVHVVFSADDYVISGDVNSDGYVNTADIAALQKYIAADPDSKIALDSSDVLSDGRVNIFDLSALKNKLSVWNAQPETEKIAAFWPTKTGQWRIKNGMSNENITLVFGGDSGNGLNLAYGYWDTAAINPETGNAGMWFNNDDTYLGKYEFDSNGECMVTFDVPDNCSSLEIILFNYTKIDESTGSTIQLDKGEVQLKKVLIN